MDNTMTVTMNTEVATVPAPTPTPITDISLDPKDFQKELAKIAAEQGMEIKDGNVVAKEPTVQTQAATQPDAMPQAAAQPTAVPDKFKTPDGQVDVAKLEKSTIHIDEALKQYQAKEIEFRKLQNEVHKLQSQVTQPLPMPVNPQAVTPEAINHALAQSNNPGQVLLQLQQMTFKAAYDQAMSDAQTKFDALQAQVSADSRARELQNIANDDPWVFTQEGINKLAEIRTQFPWINQSPEPWKEAYDKHLALTAKQQRSQGSVQIHNPKAQTVSAPATPVGAAPRTYAQPSVNLSRLSNDPKALNAYLDTLPDKEKLAFWNKTIGATKL